MQAASAGHNDQERVRQHEATLNGRAHEGGTTWRTKHAAQHYSKERFTFHLRFVMPCHAWKLSNPVGDKQGISVAGGKNLRTVSAGRCTTRALTVAIVRQSTCRIAFCCWCVALHRTASHAATHTLRVLLSTPSPCCIKVFMYFTTPASSIAVSGCG